MDFKETILHGSLYVAPRVELHAVLLRREVLQNSDFNPDDEIPDD